MLIKTILLKEIYVKFGTVKITFLCSIHGCKDYSNHTNQLDTTANLLWLGTLKIEDKNEHILPLNPIII